MKKRVIITVSILLVVAIGVGSFAFVLFRPKSLEQLIGIAKADVTQVIVRDGNSGLKWSLDETTDISICYDSISGVYRFKQIDFRHVLMNLGVASYVGVPPSITFVTPNKTVQLDYAGADILRYGSCLYALEGFSFEKFPLFDSEKAQPIF